MENFTKIIVEDYFMKIRLESMCIATNVYALNELLEC